MGVQSTIALIFAVISCYIGVYHLLIFFRSPENKSNLLFSLSCFAIFLYNIASIGLYGVQNPLDGAAYQRLQIIFIGCFSLALLWFIVHQISVQHRKLNYTISLISIIFIVFQIFDRSEWTLKLNSPLIKTFTLPLFNTKITYYEVTQGIISLISGLFVLAVYIYMLYLCISDYRKTKNKRLRYITLALSIFFISVVEDVMVSAGVYSFVYLLEFGFIGFILVITYTLSGEIIETAKVQEALEKSETRLKKIISGSPLPILVVGNQGKIELINAKFTESFGYVHSDISTLKDWWILAYPDETYRSEVINEWKAILGSYNEKNKIPLQNHRIQRKDGDIRDVELIIGNLDEIILIVLVDITERKITERNLAITTNTLDTAQQIAHLGSTYWDISTGEVNWSDELFRIFGLNPEDFRHNFNFVYHDIISNQVHPEDRAAVRHSLEKVINEGISEPVDYRIFLPDGTLRYVHADRKLFSDENGKPRYLIGYVQDITKQKKEEMEREKLISDLQQALENEQTMKEELEAAYEEASVTNEQLDKSRFELETANKHLEESLQKAEELNKLKSEFLAIVSHELRTPLTGILGFSQLLSTDNVLTGSQKEFATRIYKLSDKLQGVLNDLIEISLVESGIVKIEYFQFSLDEIVEDIYILFKDTLEQKNIEFIEDLDDTRIIFTDPARLRQILLNIIGNAVKFTETGKITLKFRITNGKYHFEISDTGIGIDDRNIEEIFEMFKQIENPKSRRFGGMGLGLAVCKKLVEALHGEIHVESEVNKGTTFYFTIPIADV